MSTDGRRDLALSFNSSAAAYQSARPDYPEDLYTDLLRITGVRPGDRALEIGCGPGKATVAMARRGLRITALEPGPDLAEQARTNLDGTGTEVITTTFEDWQPDRADGYSLVYAATSWHWLDPEIRWSKVASVLADRGHLAVFGAGHAMPEGFDPFFTEIQQTYHALGEPVIDWPPPTPDQLPDPSPEYEAAGYVVDAVRRYVWSLDYDADSYIALLNTFSGHILMPVEKRERLFAEIRRLLAERPDGLLTRHWVSTLVIAHPC